MEKERARKDPLKFYHPVTFKVSRFRRAKSYIGALGRVDISVVPRVPSGINFPSHLHYVRMWVSSRRIGFIDLIESAQSALIETAAKRVGRTRVDERR